MEEEKESDEMKKIWEEIDAIFRKEGLDETKKIFEEMDEIERKGELYKIEGSQIIQVAPGVDIAYVDVHFSTSLKLPMMVLIINKSTDFDKVHGNVNKLKALCREFEHAQGDAYLIPNERGLPALYLLRRQGVGWNMLAELLNYISLAWIMRAHYLKQKQGMKNYNVDRNGIYTRHLTHFGNIGEDELKFTYISLAIGKTEKEIEEIINQAHLDLSKNLLPWQKIKEGPFTLDRVKSKVVYFQKQIAAHRKAPPMEDAPSFLEFDLYRFQKLGYFKKTDEMLAEKETYLQDVSTKKFKQ